MNLKEVQTGYLNLLKGKSDPDILKDEYFRKIVTTDNFKILNDIIIYWRAHGIKEYCGLTSALLVKLNLFQEKITEFYRDENISNYIEELGKNFLLYLTRDRNKLVAFVSEFELSLIKVKLGSRDKFIINTNYNPEKVFNFILSGDDIPESLKYNFRVTVSSEEENNFTIELSE